MTIRLKEGYKKNLKRRVKEKNFKKTIKQINKYSKRYQFKTPKYYSHMRRRYLNKNIEDINITNLGRNYQKIISKNS